MARGFMGGVRTHTQEKFKLTHYHLTVILMGGLLKVLGGLSNQLIFV